MGYFSKMQPEGGQNTTLKSGSWARVYNNTIYHGGYGDAKMYGDQFKHGVCIWSYTTYNDWPTERRGQEQHRLRQLPGMARGIGQHPAAGHLHEQLQYEPRVHEPRYVRQDEPRPARSAPAARLCLHRCGRPADAGQRRRDGSTTLVVDDAWLFQDGTWGSALTHGVTHFPDWIAIGTVANAVKIVAVDYAAKTITLATPMTWADNAPIWLYSDSSGRRVLNGAAPDIGAHERD